MGEKIYINKKRSETSVDRTQKRGLKYNLITPHGDVDVVYIR